MPPIHARFAVSETKSPVQPSENTRKFCVGSRDTQPKIVVGGACRFDRTSLEKGRANSCFDKNGVITSGYQQGALAGLLWSRRNRPLVAISRLRLSGIWVSQSGNQRDKAVQDCQNARGHGGHSADNLSAEMWHCCYPKSDCRYLGTNWRYAGIAARAF